MNRVACFVGLDYHQHSVQVCVLDAQGRPRLNKACPNDWRAIVAAVAAVPGIGPIQGVALEACGGSADLAQELRDQAHWPAELAHAGYVARLKQSPDKSDYSDSQLLADLKRVGYLPQVWLASEYERDLRSLVHYRQSLVDQRRAVKLRVGALLREHRAFPPDAPDMLPGVNAPKNTKAIRATEPTACTSPSTSPASPASSKTPSPPKAPRGWGGRKAQKKKLPRWSQAWMDWARRAPELSESAQWIVGQLLDQLPRLDQQIRQAESRLRKVTAQDPRMRRLQKEAGIGPVTSWVLRAFIGDFNRFSNGKQLSRYCGLSPCNASSGARQADAGLIQGCNKLLRSIVIQAAHRLIRTEERWRKLSANLRGRGKPASVTVAAVANRWMRGLWHRQRDLKLQT
ncbi:MAG: IS110 family transposase [Terracidiphilus sp.]